MPVHVMQESIKYSRENKMLAVKGKHKYCLQEGRVFVIGGGKASGRMAEVLENIMGNEVIEDGIVNCKEGHYKTSKIKINTARHPVPDEKGMAGVKEMLELKNRHSIGARDLVICLVSGGGSALLPLPVEGISLEDKQLVNRLLINSGAGIQEINAVIKHLSAVKGGRLAEHFEPATVVSLIISDVIGNNPSVIASGVTAPDYSTFFDAVRVLKKYELIPVLPQGVMQYIFRGLRGIKPETPKKLENVFNHIIADNRMALEAIKHKAVSSGYKTKIITTSQTGDTTQVAINRANEIKAGKFKPYNALLIGGETTNRLPEQRGRGGRNQHYAVVSMQALSDYEGDWLVAAVATDGCDYIEGVGGAVLDNLSVEKAREMKLELRPYIEYYDSYGFLKRLQDGLIKTPDTGTNVSDIILYLFE